MSELLGRLLGRMPIGWLQLMHNRARLVAAVGGVTFANVLIFMQLGFRGALFETSVKTHRSLDADLVLVGSDLRTLREATPFPRVRLLQAAGDPQVASVTPLYVQNLVWVDEDTGDSTNFRVLGVDPRARVFVREDLQAGIAALAEADTALVDRRTRGLPADAFAAVQRGERTTFEALGRRMTFVGTFELGASFETDGTLVMSDQTFFRLFPGRAAGTPTVGLVDLAPGADPARVAQRIQAGLPEADTGVLPMGEFVAAEQRYQSQQSPIGFVFGFGVAMGFVVGLVIVYQVLSTDVQDHLSEYATFKAIGYAPRFFSGIVLEEAFALAALGFVPGFLLSSALYVVATRATALPIAMPLGRPFLVFALTVAMCVLSGLVATRRLRAADPAELF